MLLVSTSPRSAPQRQHQHSKLREGPCSCELQAPTRRTRERELLSSASLNCSNADMSGPVPVAASLSDIYPKEALVIQGARWNKLLSTFQNTYGHKANFVARSPGRVNIIGEHIDYSLYSVLPMAITADAIMAVSTSPIADGATTFKVKIANVEDSKFAAAEFDVPIEGDVEIDATQFEWTNYFKSGLRGALQLLRQKKGKELKPCSMNIMVDGTVPVGGGLSSSAAVVSTSALAVMKANGEHAVDKKQLTELAIVSERAVGVNSGG